MGRHHGDTLDAFPVPAHSHLMTPAFLATHRAAIIALGLVAVWMQVSVIPAAAVRYAAAAPEIAHLQIPYSAAAIAVILGVQLALVAAWQVLSAAAVHTTDVTHMTRWIRRGAQALMVSALLEWFQCSLTDSGPRSHPSYWQAAVPRAPARDRHDPVTVLDCAVR